MKLTAIVMILCVLLSFCSCKNAESGDKTSSTLPASVSSSDIKETVSSDASQSAENNDSSELQTSEKASSTEASSKNETSTESSSSKVSSTVTKELATWQRLYLNQLYLENSKYTKYALVEINNDDIPELYAYGETKECIYWNNGNSTYAHTLGGMQGGHYEKNSGTFMDVYIEGDHYVMEIWNIDGYFKKLFKGYEYQTLNPDGSITSTFSSEVGIMSEAEMKAEVAKHIDVDKAIKFNSKTYSYSEIQEKIKNW